MSEATPYIDDPDVTLYVGDAVEVLGSLDGVTVDAIVTSPPFWGLRDYGDPGQIGWESSPSEWAQRVAEVFSACRRLLDPGGTLWVEVGDTYSGSWGATGHNEDAQARYGAHPPQRNPRAGLKPKDLAGCPWELAFALRGDGWYWRGVYVWAKPNAMPESVTDRCATAHSYILHFSANRRYHHDGDAIREPHHRDGRRLTRIARRHRYHHAGLARPERDRWPAEQRHARSVWTIPTEPHSFGLCPECGAYWPSGAPDDHCGVRTVSHYATMPRRLAARIIAAAVPDGGLVLDPFAGSGTTGLVARQMGRRAILVELSPAYAEIASRRLGQQSLLAE